VIVRIATEGQYELIESDAEVLNELDNQAVAACDAGDEEQFTRRTGSRCPRSDSTPRT
jgi:hypothetical protein